MSNARRFEETAPTSPKSDRVKWVRALDRRALRHERGQFRVEGPQAVREALRFSTDGAVAQLYITDECAERYPEFADHPLAQRVPSEVIAAMSEASTPQGVVAIAELSPASLAQVKNPRLVVIAVDVRDPGNLGTIIRSADGAGADCVIAANSCVDAFAPKVVRAAVGSHWHLPLVVDVAVTEAISWARTHGLQVLAADGSTGTHLDAVDLTRPTAWLLGNEAWGLPPELTDQADLAVGVELYGRAESLNVASAAAVLLFASAQAQRSTH